MWSCEVETDELAPFKNGMLGVNPINLSLWCVYVCLPASLVYIVCVLECCSVGVFRTIFLWPTVDNLITERMEEGWTEQKKKLERLCDFKM